MLGYSGTGVGIQVLCPLSLMADQNPFSPPPPTKRTSLGVAIQLADMREWGF